MIISKIKPYLPSIVYIVLIILAWIIITRKFQPVPRPWVKLENLNKLQEKSVEMIVEMNKLMISLSLLALGGIGGILLQKYETLKITSLFQRLILVFSLLFAVMSIYFGYYLYLNMMEMLSNNGFDPQNPLIEQIRSRQFESFFISIILFGLLLLNSTVSPSKEEPVKVM